VIPLAAIAGLLIVLVAFLLWERRRPDPDVAALIALVDRLCRRIQAPQLAAIEDQQPVPQQNPVAVNPFSDDEYWESRELLAERLMREEVDADAANS
jgi:hypothetical protein